MKFRKKTDERLLVAKGMGVPQKVVVDDAREHGLIIYGARSLEKQTTATLHGRTTSDYDIYAKKPKKAAMRVEKKLDRALGGDYYSVKPALHKGTWKVMNNQTGRNIADYTRQPKGVRSKRIGGVRYSSVASEVRNRRRSLKDKRFSFRHGKDKQDLSIIKTSKKVLGKKWR